MQGKVCLQGWVGGIVCFFGLLMDFLWFLVDFWVFFIGFAWFLVGFNAVFNGFSWCLNAFNGFEGYCDGKSV